MSRPALWSAAEAQAATAGVGPVGWRAHGVSIDSRTMQPDDLFVALEGPSFDGHDFVAEALDKGAAAAMVHRRPSGVGGDAPLLMVEDTFAALRALGRAGRERSAARVVGLTGSVGKTGTKEALKACLLAQGSTFANAGSLNNHWGVPLSLACLPWGAEFAVFEMGMNHAGEIRDLTRLVRPRIAVITNIGAAHLAFFDSEEAVADAKSEIFEGLPADGIAVLPRDDRHYARLVLNADRAGVTRVVSFGRHEEADVRLLEAELEPAASVVSASVLGAPLSFRLPLPGAHWIVNSLAVLAAVGALEADIGTAATALGGLRPLPGRGASSELALPAGGTATLVDESYNANPLSMRAALAVVARLEPGAEGRRIAVLGDMLELGPDSPDLHARLAPAVLQSGIDLVFACGPYMTKLVEALPSSCVAAHAPDSAQLAPQVAAAVRAGDVVLVKGSLGSKMATVVRALRDGGAATVQAVAGKR